MMAIGRPGDEYVVEPSIRSDGQFLAEDTHAVFAVGNHDRDRLSTGRRDGFDPAGSRPAADTIHEIGSRSETRSARPHG